MRVGHLAPYLPDESWFRFAPRGIHGAPHTSRVLIWADRLARIIGPSGALRGEELRWAAAVHDVGRMDDGIDRGHGARSAAWVVERLPELRGETRALDLGFIAELCRWHETRDDEIERLSLELVILKDADALDRCRLGDLDPERLRLSRARTLVAPAERLERRSQDYGRVTAVEVLKAAEAMSTGDWEASG